MASGRAMGMGVPKAGAVPWPRGMSLTMAPRGRAGVGCENLEIAVDE